MTLLDRYRDFRDDPYRGYAPRGRWAARAAVGFTLAAVLVLVLTLAFAAVNPAARKPKGLGHASSLGYQSLLVPTAAEATKFHIGQAPAGSQQRVVMGSGASAGSAATTHSGAATGSHRAHGPRASYRVDANGYRVAPARDAAMVPETTWTAHLMHSTKGYPSANALQSNRKVPGSWYGYPSVLPVIDSTATRVKVRLAQRPDESTSWISRKAIVMSRIHYAIVVDISQHWLYVFFKGIQQMSFPVGTGRSGTPTPTGSYFVAFHAPPNGPGYGPVMLETSAHSKVISHFEGGDDAIIAIHGPVGSDAQIGDHGAAISNGCIRMHDRDLQQVRHVHNGSPVILTY